MCVHVCVYGSLMTDILCSFLDAKDATSLEYKIDTFSSVYKKLTGKEVVFEFSNASLE